MKIRTAYEAFWFLHDHPKMRHRETVLIRSSEQRKSSKGVRTRLRKMRDEFDGKVYTVKEYLDLHREAIHGLDIFYAKVDAKRRVNDDPKKNRFVECWLEFGPMRCALSHGEVTIQNSHDINLDCGAPTFDEALIKLARKVRRHYGDIKTPKWMAASLGGRTE